MKFVHIETGEFVEATYNDDGTWTVVGLEDGAESEIVEADVFEAEYEPSEELLVDEEPVEVEK